MDISKCLRKDTCGYFECPNICEVFCSCDWIMYEGIRQITFDRNQTLGENGERCDFRFSFF
ncbi:L-2-amino-thiazoline-4-carboxylic acid hydrolase [Fusibacter sp. JL298sf-3]